MCKTIAKFPRTRDSHVQRRRRVVAAASIVLALLGMNVEASAQQTTTDAAETPYRDASSLTSLLGLHEMGVDLSLWGWTYYAVGSEDDYPNTWGAEVELDATQTFANRVAIGADVEFLDYDDAKRGNVEQAFVSVLISPETSMLLTVGKFNTPFGVEGRDFWDRVTGTPSLLYVAQPQDMRAVMLTVPLGTTGLTVRPFAATGFNDQGHIAGHPSVGLTVEYRANEKFSFAVTNWFGPGLQSSADASGGGGEGGDEHVYGGDYEHNYGYDDDDEEEYEHDYDDDDEYEHEDYSHDYGGGYATSALHLSSSWFAPEGFESAQRGNLYFIDVQSTWKPRRDLLLAGEFLFGMSRVDSHDYWHGVLLLTNYQFDDQWRAFAHWSYLDDSDGVVTGVEQRRQAVGVGLGYQVNRYVELRTEYRHDYGDEADEVDSVSFHASFGY